MSYASRTKLSCDSSACTVLTDDYVFVTSGLGANQRMPLADWRIIIGGETIRDEFIPLAAAVHSGSAAAPEFIPLAGALHSGSAAAAEFIPVAGADPAPEPEPAAAAAVPEPPAIGTKWVWSLTDIPQNYRVAIQTKQGALQVKSVSCSRSPSACDYAVNLRTQMFATYQAWCDSLPPGGAITTTLPQDRLSHIDKRRDYCSKMLAGGGTADAILKLQREWKVRTQIYRQLSINQRIKSAEEEISQLRDDLQKLTLEDDMNFHGKRRCLTRRLGVVIGRLSWLRTTAAQQTPAQNSHRNAWFTDSYKQRLYVHTSLGKLQIAYDTFTQSIAVWLPANRITFVKRLEELPFSIGADLHLSVLWHRKEIDLTA